MTDEMEEIWLLYVDDGSQSLDAVERAVTRLREHPSDTGAIGLLFRSMHTFKGNSRILGLATIEHTAHVAEDLIGIVRDEGVPIDVEIIELLIEAADALRAMMDRAYRSRADESVESGFDLPMRLKDKISRCRAGSGTQAATIHATTTVEANTADDDAPFAEALLFDATSVRLADDPVYREIFFETARAALDQMQVATKDGGCAGSPEPLLGAIAEIREMAERIAMPEWPEAVRAAEAALRADAEPAVALARLEELYRCSKDSTSAVDGGSTLSERGRVCEATSEEPVPGPIVTALAAILGQADERQDTDRPSVVAFAGQIAGWATQNGLPGIADVCEDLAACAAGDASFEPASFRLADYLSRLEGNPQGGATRRLEQWSLARSPKLLGELSNAIVGVAIDWARVATSLEELGPACAGCGRHAAREVVQLVADLCCRVRDGELAADRALRGIVEGLVAGLRMALASRTADGRPDFASAEAILTEAATAAERLVRAPELAELERSLGLPSTFDGALSPESAENLRSAIEAGQHLYVVRADLGQDEELADSFMNWLGSQGRSCICSITVYNQGSTAFDFLVATNDDQREIRAALLAIAKGSSALTLISALGQSDGAAAVDAIEIEPEPGSDGHVDADALSEIVGELATARSTTRQVLAGFIEADLPAQADRMLQELMSDPRMLREELTRMMVGWQDKIEQLLQVEAKAATDLDQLSEITARIRQRPAGPMLDRIVEWGRNRAGASKVVANFSCIGKDCSIDVSHIAPLEAALRQAVECCLPQAAVPSAIEIEVAPRDTAIEATVTVTHLADSSRDQAGDAIDPPEGAATQSVDVLLDAVAGYAISERPRGGGARMRLVIPRRTSMIDGMIVRVSDTKYVLPVHSIQRIVETTHGSIVRVSAQSSQRMLRLSRSEVLPVQSLGSSSDRVQLIDLPVEETRQPDYRAEAVKEAAAAQLFVITSTRDGRIAVPVDELLGQETIVVRPIQGYLASLRAVAGCTILAAGDVGIVVDPNAIARAAAA